MAAIDRILRSGKVESFGKATAADIALFQRTHALDLSSDYCAFLLRCNGMLMRFTDEDVRRAGLPLALSDINTFYGIGNGRDYADLALMLPRYYENAKRLAAFAPDIAVGGDSCTYVEIAEGAYARQIMYTDGEMSRGVLAEVDWDEPADELIASFLENGFFMPVAETFDELLDMYAKMT